MFFCLLSFIIQKTYFKNFRKPLIIQSISNFVLTLITSFFMRLMLFPCWLLLSVSGVETRLVLESHSNHINNGRILCHVMSDVPLLAQWKAIPLPPKIFLSFSYYMLTVIHLKVWKAKPLCMNWAIAYNTKLNVENGNNAPCQLTDFDHTNFA